MRISEQVEDAANVLVLADSMHTHTETACHDLTTTDRISDSALIAVTLTQSPDRQIAFWQDHLEERPATATIIGVGEDIQSATTRETPHAPLPTSAVTIEAVSSPGDLTGLGITLTEYVTDTDRSAAHVALCFRSITTLFQYADFQRIFRFFHIFTNKVRDGDVTAHYHMNPVAHDPKEVNALKSLFDAVVELHDDEEIEVYQRF